MRVASVSPGSPSPDRIQTRERVLDAAENLFADLGYRATSVRDITSQAGCNLAAVNYHFGGKLGLYRVMFIRRLRAVRQQRIAGIHRAMEEAGRHASLELLLRAFTTAFLEPHLGGSRGRLLMRLIAHEVADPHLPTGAFQEEMLEPVQKELAQAIAVVHPGLKGRAARRCIHSIVAQLVQVVQMRQMPAPAGRKGAGDFAFPGIVEHIVRFSAAGIRASRT